MMERELILKAKTGNKEAFASLINAYSKRIYYAAYSFLRNIDDAFDIVQEVFLRAYKNITSFDHNRAFYPWIYQITKNLCINKIKRKDSKNLLLPEYDFVQSHYELPDTSLLNDENIKKIRAGMDALPAGAREIIILKHFEDCSYAEIAEILDIPIGTVMSRLYNARKKLREILFSEDSKNGMP